MMTMREDSIVKPTSVSITPVEVDSVSALNNPLANISTEDLLEELERRGIR